ERGQGPFFMKSFEGDRVSASGQIDQLPSPLDERSSEMRTIRAVSHLQSCGDLHQALAQDGRETCSSTTPLVCASFPRTAKSPSDTMPTSFLARERIGRRRICFCDMTCEAFSRSSSS